MSSYFFQENNKNPGYDPECAEEKNPNHKKMGDGEKNGDEK